MRICCPELPSYSELGISHGIPEGAHHLKGTVIVVIRQDLHFLRGIVHVHGYVLLQRSFGGKARVFRISGGKRIRGHLVPVGHAPFEVDGAN